MGDYVFIRGRMTGAVPQIARIQNRSPKTPLAHSNKEATHTHRRLARKKYSALQSVLRLELVPGIVQQTEHGRPDHTLLGGGIRTDLYTARSAPLSTCPGVWACPPTLSGCTLAIPFM